MIKNYYLPMLAITIAILSGCGKPDDSSSSNSASAAEKKAQIDNDCGTTKEETEAWFATHKTGWAEHVEAGLKCIRDHQ
jgi:hypothetical protein